MTRQVLRSFLTYSFVASLAFLTACGSNGKVDSGSSDLNLDQKTYNTTISENGSATITFPNSGTSFQMVTTSAGGIVRLISLIDPNGSEVIRNTSENTSQALGNQLTPGTANFPFVIGNAISGNYTATFRLDNAASTISREAALTVVSKRDSDLRRGTLKVNIILVGPAAGSTELINDLEGAVNTMKAIYSRAGISIDPQFYQFSGPDILPDPRTGDALYESIVFGVRPYAVNIVFGSNVRGTQTSNDTRFGIAGGTPGPSLPTTRSLIALSILQLTGGDGDFDSKGDEDSDDNNSSRIHNDELRLAAEEMSRLTGLYLGLENVIEFNGNRVISTDSLPDTESCLTLENCRDTKFARSNVMMPRPLRKNDSGDEYYAREAFTDQQRDVLNRNVLVD